MSLSQHSALSFWMFCDSQKLAFLLPDEKKLAFVKLRDYILSSEIVSLKTLQRFAGKCISLVLAIPASRLFSREVNRAISLASKNSREVVMYKELREELLFWKFIDNWRGFSTWREERHLQCVLATDSSAYKWGAFLLQPSKQQEFGDFWNSKDSRPIHVKEAQAVFNALSALKDTISDHRVDVFCDNMAVVKAWSNQGARDPSLNSVLKDLFVLTFDRNLSLHMQYVQSESNPADKESRRLSGKDATLMKEKWAIVEEAFGPHSVDLMAIESNVMLDRNQNKLKYYSPFPMKSAAGVNIFSQDLSREENAYVFPPFCLVFPVLKFLQQSGIRECTIIVPALNPVPMWWPLLWSLVIKWLVLAHKGDLKALLYPTKNGYQPDSKGLEFDLIVARLKFN